MSRIIGIVAPDKFSGVTTIAGWVYGVDVVIGTAEVNGASRAYRRRVEYFATSWVAPFNFASIGVERIQRLIFAAKVEAAVGGDRNRIEVAKEYISVMTPLRYA